MGVLLGSPNFGVRSSYLYLSLRPVVREIRLRLGFIYKKAIKLKELNLDLYEIIWDILLLPYIRGLRCSSCTPRSETAFVAALYQISAGAR